MSNKGYKTSKTIDKMVWAMKPGLLAKSVSVIVSLLFVIGVFTVAVGAEDSTGLSTLGQGNPGLGDEFNLGDSSCLTDEWEGLLKQERNQVNLHTWTQNDDDSMHMFQVEHKGQQTRLAHFCFEANESLYIGMDHTIEGPNHKHLLQFRIQFTALVEFRDMNGNNAFDIQSDEVISRIDLSGSDGINKYNSITSRNIETDQGTYSVTETTSLDGHFGLKVYTSNDDMTLGNTPIGQNKMKFDLEIMDYPFEEADTQVALVGGMVHDKKMNQMRYRNTNTIGGNGSSGFDITDGSGRNRGGFSWLENATVDGVDTNVRTTFFKEGSEFVGFAFAYDRGDNILHDPEMNIIVSDSDYRSLDISKIFSPSTAVFIGAIIATMVLLVITRRIGRR